MATAMPYLEVLSEFGLFVSSGACRDLGNAGGFSGARLWRVSRGGRDYCLRRWPSGHPDISRLQWIHQVLTHAARNGVNFIPVPIPTLGGNTIVNHGDRLWELTPWLEGAADDAIRPSPARLVAALSHLGRFHQAASTFPSHGDLSFPPRMRPAPTVRDRLATFEHWNQDACQQLARMLHATPRSELVTIAQEILSRYATIGQEARRHLEPWAHVSLRISPCIRDIWQDHVFYVGDCVSGFVDFGAMRPDTVATDVARLLGSMAGDQPQLWQDGLQAFQQAFPLETHERALVRVLDACSVTLSGLNWLQWIFVERRSFEDWPAIETRLRSILRRMEHRG